MKKGGDTMRGGSSLAGFVNHISVTLFFVQLGRIVVSYVFVPINQSAKLRSIGKALSDASGP